MKAFTSIAAFATIVMAMPNPFDQVNVIARDSIQCTASGNVPTYHDCANCCAKKGCIQYCGLPKIVGDGCEEGWSQAICK
ncbi:Ecp25 [Fulvia fulva]|uniref:Ecp25 n=1 Tax=Passalora fulva TaxID=5499 RepID=A0A1P8YXJ1_PASFU|nr:Ecp25 [Fulvia fulva]AQA29218.1 extracellular protein 25 [Fulvia fulva]KAK4615502.1 Ecp25 [Fulvia fulva]KAK4616536.1 Ecp25 [Fulvia fulva]UJO23134.1 Ecp25 [Fulvia fulva]WPV19586.1 Ecp25 [Fulvia fulva]